MTASGETSSARDRPDEMLVAFNVDLEGAIAASLAIAPAWIRTDLNAKDAVLRQHAEEVLAAMIAAALAQARG